jgi:methyltransferase-like protein/2-polyprenyl-3-methyl-5-hydroxy-6-metoxy-1,4-benzoquinol methylase
MAEFIPDPYDEVPYPGYVHSQTHPDRLAVIGTLLGMRPAPVTNCRVLELGCGEGANLIPMAASLSESEFVGVDRASSSLKKGEAVVRYLGLENISLRQLDLMEVQADLGDFDYIIAHGVYAWVPDQVKNKILSICKSHLKPHGIAYISYNAYPGGHLTDMMRNMLLFHLRNVSEPKQRMKQSIAFLKFLTESQPETNAYSQLLKDELKETLDGDPALLYHDRIGAINTPTYFFQFINHAAQHELQFLSEADFFECQYHIYPAETVKLLERLAQESVILKEQYLDFLKCRRFRQTLLCHSKLKLNSEGDSQPIADMFVAACAKPANSEVDFRPGVVVQFVGPRGAKVSTDYPVAKAALVHLADVYPRTVAFPKLLETARGRAGKIGDEEQHDEREALLAILLSIYGTGLVELYPRAADYVSEVSERPLASPLARFQIERDSLVTNLRHISVDVTDEIGRQLLRLLDGTRDLEMLTQDLTAAVISAKGLLDSDGLPVRDHVRARAMVTKDLELNLQKLAKLALLSR